MLIQIAKCGYCSIWVVYNVSNDGNTICFEAYSIYLTTGKTTDSCEQQRNRKKTWRKKRTINVTLVWWPRGRRRRSAIYPPGGQLRSKIAQKKNYLSPPLVLNHGHRAGIPITSHGARSMARGCDGWRVLLNILNYRAAKLLLIYRWWHSSIISTRKKTKKIKNPLAPLCESSGKKMSTDQMATGSKNAPSFLRFVAHITCFSGPLWPANITL